MRRKTRVLIVDDSAIVRRILTDALASQPDIEVVGTAPDAYVARDKILALDPDVLTLDIEMPRMDGLTFLRRLMQHRPLPVIIISSPGQASCEAAVAALREGAVEVLAKPGGPYSVGDLANGLAEKIRAAAASRVRSRAAGDAPSPPAPDRRPAAPAPGSRGRLIAIGASTGGTQAIEQVLLGIAPGGPGMVIVQHIPAGFSRAFAERLDRVCSIRVKEAADGDAVSPGTALVAPGNFHMAVRRAPEGFLVAVRDGPPVCYQRPSVDVLFASVAQTAGANAVGVILTGMGRDGAEGLLKMRQAGAFTIGQDEATSVVFGMPGEALKAGAVDRVLPLGRISAEILRAASAGPR